MIYLSTSRSIEFGNPKYVMESGNYKIKTIRYMWAIKINYISCDHIIG